MFECTIVPDNRSTIMDDAFILSYIGELLRSLRTQYLIDLIKPYTRLELSFLARVRISITVLYVWLTLCCSNLTYRWKKSKSFLLS